MIDFNSKSQLSDRINHYLDQSLETENQKQSKRNYLGGSRLGVECERALQYEYFHAPKDEGKDFPGRVLRIFARGFWIEDYLIKVIRQAGYDLQTHNNAGYQFGFKALDGKIQGHCDGVFVGGLETMVYPALWECKGIQEKDWKLLVKEKLKKKYPVYFAQVQIYQKHFGLTENPAIFTACNMNKMELYHEKIDHDPAYTELLEAKGRRIIQACEAGELLPRMSQDPNFYICKHFCSYGKRCFKE